MANLVNPSEFHRQSFAQDGFRVVDNTFSQPVGEEYVAVYCTATATNVATTSRTGDNLPGIDLQIGMIIYGDFTAVSVGTGAIIAYIK